VEKLTVEMFSDSLKLISYLIWLFRDSCGLKSLPFEGERIIINPSHLKGKKLNLLPSPLRGEGWERVTES